MSMAILRRVRSVHTGLPGAPYLSTHYFTDVESTSAQELIAMVGDFWTALTGVMVNDNVITVQPEVDRIDDVTGDVVGQDVGVVITRTGLDAGAPEWTAKQGNMNLRTDLFVGGRRLRGRLYIPGVALAAGEQAPTSAYRTEAGGAAAILIEDSSSLGPWRIWSRKNGTSAVVTGGSIAAQWASLRSRRQ